MAVLSQNTVICRSVAIPHNTTAPRQPPCSFLPTRGGTSGRRPLTRCNAAIGEAVAVVARRHQPGALHAKTNFLVPLGPSELRRCCARDAGRCRRQHTYAPLGNQRHTGAPQDVTGPRNNARRGGTVTHRARGAGSGGKRHSTRQPRQEEEERRRGSSLTTASATVLATIPTKLKKMMGREQ